jgi:hypothetical protein
MRLGEENTSQFERDDAMDDERDPLTHAVIGAAIEVHREMPHSVFSVPLCLCG